MLKIGITGGIGSGKSTVSRIFNVLGIPVFDADSEAKKLMESNVNIMQAIQNEFGADTYIDGKLNRALLANLVFIDTYKLDKLNALVHPITIAYAETWMEQQTSAYVVKEAALFFESGSAANLDFMIGVYAPQHIRIYRAMKRDQILREQVLERINRQVDEEMKMRLCDYVIQNDEQQLLIPQVLQLHNKFLELTAK